MPSRKHRENSVNGLQVVARHLPSLFARLPLPLPVEVTSIFSDRFSDEPRGVLAVCSHDSMADPYYWLVALVRAGILRDMVIGAPIAMHQMEKMGLVIKFLEVAIGGVALPIYTKNSHKGEPETVREHKDRYLSVARQTISEGNLVALAAMGGRGLLAVASEKRGPLEYLAQNNIGDPDVVFVATHVGKEISFGTRHRRMVVSGPVGLDELVTASGRLMEADFLARCILAANGGDNTIDPRTIGEAKKMINNKFGSDRSRTILTSV